MREALWIVRVYSLIIMFWAVSMWFGGLPNPPGEWLHLIVAPVWLIFGWAQIGPFSFAAIIALIVLFTLESWLRQRINEDGYYPGKPPDSKL
jgi:hypothetical protein